MDGQINSILLFLIYVFILLFLIYLQFNSIIYFEF